LKRVEKEAFFKSFFLFFFLQTFLVGGIYFLQYQKGLTSLDKSIFSKMRVCSFSLECKEYTIDFVKKKNFELYKLYKTDTNLSSYFLIPNSKEYLLKISLSISKYNKKKEKIKHTLLVEFVGIVIVIALLSALFALYTMAPLRNALLLTQEFIKDILHDFNTPLATLRLNIATLESKCQEHKKQLHRIKKSVQTILNLQENLRFYLHSHKAQIEKFYLVDIIQERIEALYGLYPDINFFVDIKHFKVLTNKSALQRIIDNLLSNAAKYNKKGGFVKIYMQDTTLVIQDSAKGIKNVKKVFNRFYKEQERGIGIGLHIVKKLCDELGIGIHVESEVGKGSRFFLNIKNLL
jgi:signal transduction histidine kinase